MNDNELNNSKEINSWKNLLEDYLKSNNNPNQAVEQEKEANELFLEYINEDTSNHPIPRFYYKKPINYNDLLFAVKSEAKSRFLSMKSYEIPQKKSKSHY